MKNFEIQYGPISIGNNAFYQTTLSNVLLPNSVISIGDYSFANIGTLHYINLSSNLKIIGNHAIEGAGNIEQLVIPSSVTEIGEGSFNTQKPIPIFVYLSDCPLTDKASLSLDYNSKVVVKSTFNSNDAFKHLNKDLFEMVFLGSTEITNSETCNEINSHARIIYVTNDYNQTQFCDNTFTQKSISNLLPQNIINQYLINLSTQVIANVSRITLPFPNIYSFFGKHRSIAHRR